MDDKILSFLISHYLLGTDEFIVITHTDYDILKFKDEELQKPFQGFYELHPLLRCHINN